MSVLDVAGLDIMVQQLFSAGLAPSTKKNERTKVPNARLCMQCATKRAHNSKYSGTEVVVNRPGYLLCN